MTVPARYPDARQLHRRIAKTFISQRKFFSGVTRASSRMRRFAPGIRRTMFHIET